MLGLVSGETREIVLNVRNGEAIEDMEPDDVVEIPCQVNRDGAHLARTGRLPGSVRGLVQSVKAYERTTVAAALRGSRLLAQLALMECPIVGQWELAGEVLGSLIDNDPVGLGALK